MARLALCRSLYLINPRAAIAGYFGADVFAAAGLANAVGIADLATTTVAALAPPHWQVTICDEHLTPAELDTPAEFIGLTGKVTQAPRLLELAAEFRRRGKTVIAGGPWASLAPDDLRGKVDILVTGEIENIAERLFADLERGRWQHEYAGDRPDLAASPLPRWSLYPNERALIGCVQTSRGCPFDCEFCDVIAYLGRRQRHKPVDRVLAELDCLYALGYRSAFLADDNFTVYRRRARELLAALRDWNARAADGPMLFSTQLSIDAAREPDLLALAADAGIDWVFIGLETPNAASLRECRKPQNLLLDLHDGVATFLEHGIAVTGGMIVGFDHDGPDIFDRQYEFAMAAPIPVFSLGALVAPAATPLHERLAAAGRLVDGRAQVAALPWDTNIVPAGISRAELLAGLRRLSNALYAPENFGARLAVMIDRLAPHPLSSARPGKARAVELEAALVAKQLARLGPAEAQLLHGTLRRLAVRPHAARAAMTALFRYAQVRLMYAHGGFWEPRPSPATAPAVVRSAGA